MKIVRLAEGDVIRLRGFQAAGSGRELIEFFESSFPQNPIGDGFVMFGSVIVELSPRGGDTVSLTNIKSLESSVASRALKTLTDAADEMGVTLKLYACQYSDRGLTVEQLVDWYARNGFEIDQSRWADRGVDMVRHPK